MPDFPRVFAEALAKPLQRGVSLSEYSSFRIGGRARYFFEARELGELMAAVELCRREKRPYYLIGSGTNLLFDDAGFRGLIIKNSCRGISLRGPGEVEALSGTGLSDVCEFAAKHALQGMEFLAGIPGTVGGAVFGNAGAFGWSISEALAEAVLLDRRGAETAVSPEFFEFGYRRSVLRTNHAILLKVVLRLSAGDEGRIRAQMDEYLSLRQGKHPPRETACAGCYFKNPVLADGSKVAAGQILEKAGAKALKSGGAAVSAQHGNFIVNEGRAKAKDVLRLASKLKDKVRELYGYELEEEVIYLPANASMP